MTDEARLSKYLRKVTGDLRDAQRRIDELEQRAAEPLAIVGIGCRYPGGVRGAEGLWELVAAGRDAISPLPGDRGWPLETLIDPDPDRPGTSYVDEGGFLDDAAEFDAGFFGIAPREALTIDPQQRLLLEVAWELFEDAGLDPAELAGSATGVFAGTMHYSYGSDSDDPELEGHRAASGAASVLSGRIAYTFGLEGPAVTLDTACSSSLVAIHLAAQSLRGGECDLAIAGGATVMAEPGQFVEFSRQRALAPNGRCKPFAAAADGNNWSEGVGLILLERLADARRNGHRVLALVRGSATNQDGASNGITAPNGPSQERVIRQALASAGLEPGAVDAVDAHGTGTPLGDPIEAQALLATYGQGREGGEALRLGAIKSNLGHTQAAAGVAGVIKMTMAMREGMLPKILHFDEPTPHVDWSAGAVEPLAEARPWEAAGHPRRAGVSSFGISGTNAHVILEEAPAAEPVAEEEGGEEVPPPATIPLPLSARGEPALREGAGRLAIHLRERPELDLADVGFSLATTRAVHSHRAVALGGDREELLAALDALAAGRPQAGAVRGRAAIARTAFLFPGQGAEWEGMALGLLAESPHFAERIGACSEALDPYLDFSVEAVLRGSAGAPSLERIDVVQPVLFAVMVSLARLWQFHGVEPDAVLGHSQGEVAAAHVAGALSLDDAALVVARRSQAATELIGKGEMAALALGAEQVRERIEPWGGSLILSVINGPTASVVSGEPAAIAELLAACEGDGVRAKLLPARFASHCPLVEPIRERLLRDLAAIEPAAASVPFYSAMTAAPLAGQELGPEYWYRSLQAPVRFEGAVRALLADGFDGFVEVGGHPVLTMAVEETAEASEPAVAVATIGSLRRGEGGLARFTAALAEAQVRGAGVDWRPLLGSQREAVPLPTYAFQRRRYWLAPGSGEADVAAAGLGAAAHPLLGASTFLPGDGGWLLTGRLALASHPWLGDHRVFGTAILPGTAFVELAFRAAAQAGAEGVEELTIEAPLILPERGGAQLQLRVGEVDAEGSCSFAIHSRPDDPEGTEGEWVLNASGVLGAADAEEPRRLAQWPPAGAEPIALDTLYERTAALGIEYGPAFQGARAAWRRGEEVFAEAELDPDQAAKAEAFALHPALLDAAFHPGLIVDAERDGASVPKVPFSWRGVRLHRGGAARLRLAVTRLDDDTAALTVADDSGQPVASVRSLAGRPIAPEALAGGGADPHRDSLFAIEWVERELAATGEEAELVELSADPELDRADAAAELCQRTLNSLREAIAVGEGRLAFLTAGAVAVTAAEAPDPALAAAWGLVRSAQAEHPGRFLLIDSDGGAASRGALATALRSGEEPQLALRDGVALAPRLARAGAETVEPVAFDPERTALLTGGTGALGSLLARHLVLAHGARHLLLTSRRGLEAPGAPELVAELEALGAEVRVAACDVAERSQLAELLDSIPAAHPLGSVFHAAAVFDNALVETMSAEQLRRVLAVKAGAAWSLHELTAGAELSDFFLFSSTAGSFENPGQGNYAAANAFLDALAQHRAAAGLAASSVAWGLWEQELGGPSERIVDADLARLLRGGFVRMSPAQGMELFERTRALDAPFAIAAALDLAALRGQAARGELSPLYSGLVQVRARRAAAASGSLGQRLAAAPEAEREGIAVALIAEHAAAILGHDSAAEIDPAAAFKDLGFDSLGAVELRNRLGEATGLALPSTLVFDYPTPAAAASFLRGLAEGQSAAPASVRVLASSEEPIAIVGMSCRFPGGIDSPARLWRLLAAGEDAISPFPGDRGWDLERLFDPDPDRPDTSYVRVGGFLDGAADFDAGFFGVSPREAQAMDPQLRLAQEAAWEALEDAGIDPASLAGSATGVFAGVMHHDYGLIGGGSAPSGYEGATSGGSAVSGRISYALGLEGPAMTVDTACSSSLVALHLAAQSLRSGECELALAGGSSVASTPGMYTMFSRQRGLAADGRCKPFAAAADGTGISEGVGLLVLERLSEAERNGHEVLAIVRGSATNQDGASNGLTAPNGPAQERVIMQALANAGLEPSEVDAVEAHGTGTKLGDPIEAQALLATYGQGREDGEPLKLGAIKSNLGHTQAAAGVAGVIKMTLAMREGVLPKTLHFDEPTPHVDWSAGAVEVLTEASPWERGEHPRRAGVSSFGLSGTNAHVILEEAPARATEPSPDAAADEAVFAVDPAIAGQLQTALQGALALPLSAKSTEALAEQAQRLAAHLRHSPELELADVGFSLATTRATLEHRATAIGSDRDELLEALDALGAGKPHPGATQGRAANGKLAFLFSGQGAQRPGAGQGLYESLPPFASALDETCAELEPLLGRPLKHLLFAEEGSEEAKLLGRTEYTQPALFALEVALYRQLESWGLTPDYLLGHSIGELAAAHVAGVFDLPDACKLIAARGALMGALPEGGAMVAIEASEAEVREELPAGLSIAGVNSPTSVVVSGEEKAALKLAESWKGKGRKTTRLRVSHAFHSALMEPMLAELAEAAATIHYNPPRIPVLSNLTGEPLTPEQATDPSYWVAQVREAVRFADGAAYLANQGVTNLLELGPDGVLCAMAQGAFAAAEKDAVAAPALRKGREEPSALLGALATVQANGAPLDWATLFPNAKRVPLPTYAFQRQRYWLAAGSAEADVAAAGQSASEHPLLGAAISLPGDQGWLLTGRLSTQTHPWLSEHQVHATTILPGAAFVEMGLKAAEQAGAEGIEELAIEAPLVLPEQGAVQVQVSVGPADENGSRSLAIHSRPEDREDSDGEWALNASGSLGAVAEAEQAFDLTQWPPQGAEPLDLDSLYERAAELGVDYGPAFQGVRAAWRRGAELFAEVELDSERAGEAERFGLHPALLDAALQPRLLDLGPSEATTQALAWRDIRAHGTGATGARVVLAAGDGDTFSLSIADPGGAPLASAESISFQALAAESLGAAAADPHRDSLFEIEWVECELEASGEEAELVELAPDPELGPASAALALGAEAMTHLREAIEGGEGRLAFVTQGAMAVGDGEPADPAAAAVWGLVRSAQAEHPERFLLIDRDGSAASRQALAAALASAEEPQLALREGVALAPRLVRASTDAVEPTPLDPERTVLITGATGDLGALFARHLVAEHGARHLLLASRGPDAPGAQELVAELTELGATVDLVACDVAERSQLQELLDSIPDEHPLGAVFHIAGALPAAASNLHELTAEAELSEFVLFSAAVGLFGAPGQGDYAAANAFLDALAQRRRAEGLAAAAIAWRDWEQENDAPALYDRARALDAALVLAASLDFGTLRAWARADALPPLFSGLVRAPVRRDNGSGGASLAARLAAAPEEEREGIVLALVAEQAAVVLGHAAAAAIDPDVAFKELGFDSLGAVEFRNRLGRATGLRLPSTLVFDHPNVAEVAAHVATLVDPDAAADDDVETTIDRLGEMLDELDRERREQASTRLRSLLSRGYAADADAGAVDRIEAASAAEILQIINDEIGAK